MAVIDAYVNTNLAAGTRVRPEVTGLGEVSKLIQTFEVAAADDDGSKYRICRVSSAAIPAAITIMCDAITGGTDYDLGIYKTLDKGGSVVDADVLMDGQTLASASKTLDGMGIVDKANYGKSIAELLVASSAITAVANADDEYDLVLTANTVGTAAGTVTIVGDFVRQ